MQPPCSVQNVENCKSAPWQRCRGASAVTKPLQPPPTATSHGHLSWSSLMVTSHGHLPWLPRCCSPSSHPPQSSLIPSSAGCCWDLWGSHPSPEHSRRAQERDWSPNCHIQMIWLCRDPTVGDPGEEQVLLLRIPSAVRPHPAQAQGILGEWLGELNPARGAWKTALKSTKK